MSSLKKVIIKVKNEFNSERVQREAFEENIFKILDETSQQMNEIK